jgi:hypothetical protein
MSITSAAVTSNANAVTRAIFVESRREATENGYFAHPGPFLRVVSFPCSSDPDTYPMIESVIADRVKGPFSAGVIYTPDAEVPCVANSLTFRAFRRMMLYINTV